MASGARVLSEDEAWGRLRSHDLGRLAVSVRGHPFVFPVNYLVDEDIVVFRTGEGTKLDNVFSSPSIALEADGIDDDTGEAWSVIVVGHALPVADPDRTTALESQMPPAWVGDDPPYLIEIHPDEITGRLHQPPATT